MKWFIVLAYVHLIPVHPNTTDFSMKPELTIQKLEIEFDSSKDCEKYGGYLTDNVTIQSLEKDAKFPNIIYRCYGIPK